MRRFIILFLIVTTSFLLAACSPEPPDKVGILDMDRVLQESERAQKMQQELLDIGNRLESEYQEKKEELSEDDGEEELDRIYQEYQTNKQRLESGLNKEITDIIGEIAASKKLGVVIFKNSVYYGGVDITEEVITNLDKKKEDEEEGGETG